MTPAELSARLRDLPASFAMCDDEHAQPIILAAATALDALAAENERVRSALAKCLRVMTVPLEDDGEKWNEAIADARSALERAP